MERSARIRATLSPATPKSATSNRRKHRMSEPARFAMAHLPRSIATVSLSGTLPEKLDAAATIGFDAVEIFENDLLTFDGSPADVRRIAADLGIAIVLYQPFRDFEAMPEPQRARNLDRAERKFDVMQALGTDLVLVCSNTLPAAIDDDARAAADLAEMAERAAARGPARGVRGAGLGAACQPMAARMADRAAGRPSRARTDRRQLPYPRGGRRSRRHRRAAGRKTVLRAACRRATAGDGCAVLEPAFPQFSRPGPVAGRTISCARCWRAAIAGRFRWRFSTTNSAPPRRG